MVVECRYRGFFPCACAVEAMTLMLQQSDKETFMRHNRLRRLSGTWMLVGCFGIMLGASIYAQRAGNSDKAAERARVLLDPRATVDAKGKACQQLMDLGPAAVSAVPALVQQLNDRNEILRDYAVTTLSKIGSGAAAALPALQQVAQGDASNEIRQLAADAIKKIKAAAGAPPAGPGPLDAGGTVPPPRAPSGPPPNVQPPRPPNGQPPPGALPRPGVQLGQYALPDPYLHCMAWTFVAPVEWKREGGVYWTGSLTPGPAYSTTLSIRNPEGTQEFTLYPIFMFVQTDYAPQAGGIEIQRLMDPPTCIRQIILPRCRRDVRDVQTIASEPLPKLAEQTIEQARASGLAGIQGALVTSARMLVEYTVQGTRMEEMIYCTVAAMPGPMGSVSWGVDRAFSYRAEKGKLRDAMPILGTIGSSLKENSQWVASRRQRLQQLVAARSQPPRTTLNSGGPSILDVSRKMARDQDDFLRSTDASIAARDRASGVYGSVPRNTQLTRDPVLGEQVEVENGYLHYYRDYYGRVYGSDLNATDFYTQYHISATELQQKK